MSLRCFLSVCVVLTLLQAVCGQVPIPFLIGGTPPPITTPGGYPYPIPVGYSYTWVVPGITTATAGYGACNCPNTAYETGTATRSVICQQTANGVVTTVANENCYKYIPSAVIPPSTLPCSCATTFDYAWDSNNKWSECNFPCGGGSQTRAVLCRNTATQKIAFNQQCTAVRPATAQRCNTQACPLTYSWYASDTYGECTLPCGGGRQYLLCNVVTV